MFHYKQINGKQYEHRVVWEQANGPIPDGFMVDHINGDGRDNRLVNLRLVDHSDNAKNAKRYSTNKSGVTGVSWDTAGRKWMASICSRGKREVLGRFDTLFDAACSRKSAEVRYNFHANHGRRT